MTRSIIHLLEETNANNDRAANLLGYAPKIPWQDAVCMQMDEMVEHQKAPMKMRKPIK